ncbi:hypothetical protein ACVMDO_000110 [Bradyrhizobium sp. USDA 4513]
MLLPAGKMHWKAVAHAFNLQELHYLLNTVVDACSEGTADPQWEGDVFIGRQMRKKAVALWHDAKLALFRRETRDIGPVQMDTAAVRRGEASENCKQRRLA